MLLSVRGLAVTRRAFNARSLSAISLTGFGDAKTVAKVVPSVNPGEPSASDVKIKMRLSRVSFEDIRSVNGFSSINRTVGLAGTTGVGSVVKVGSATKSVVAGDTVLVSTNGTWNDEIIANAASVFPVPGKLSAEQLASVDVVASALVIVSNLKTGGVVLVDDINSALNAAIIGIAKLKNFKVVVKNSAGVLSAIDGGKVDSATLRVPLIVTSSTGSNFNHIAQFAEFGGNIVSILGPLSSIASVEAVNSSVRSLVFNDVRLRGFDFNSWAKGDKASCACYVAEAATLLGNGSLTIPASKSFPHVDFQSALFVAAEGKGVVLTF